MISRRDFLRASLMGASACALGPSMSALAAGTGDRSVPKRFVFMRAANGLWPKKLVPPTLSDDLMEKEKNQEAFEAGLDQHELPEYLHGLNDHKEHLSILQGMSSKMSLNGHHSFQSIMGLFRAKNASINTLKRTSIDYELAKLYPSPLGHVELSFAKERQGIVDGWSVPAPYQKNFCYADSITAYNNLFRCVLNPESLSRDIEMFDYIHKNEKRMVSSVSGPDSHAQDNHLQTLDSIGKRNADLLAMRESIAKLMPSRELVYAKGNATAFTTDKQDAMTEIMAAIMISGLTNVVTYTFDSLDFHQSGIPGVEQAKIHNHSIGHNQATQGVPAEEIRKQVRLHHFKQVRTLVDKLKAQPEGSGTMFDNTVIMYFPEGGEAHHGGGGQSPWVVVSGKNCNLDIAGRYIRLPRHCVEGHKTLGNWYTTLLNAHGNPIKHYGDMDSTMTARSLPQTGPIKRFLRA